MGPSGREPLVRGLLALAVAVLPAVLAVQVGWFGGADDAAAAREGGEGTPAAPVADAPGAPPPEMLDEAILALLATMGSGGSDLSYAPDRLPPALRAFLLQMGADLLLGVGVAEAAASVTVEAVFPGSPAERSGLARGDVITALDGEPVAGAAGLRAAVEAVAPGATYVLTLRRAGAVQAVEVAREPRSVADAWRAELLRTLAFGLLFADRPGGSDFPPSLLGELVEETPDGLRVVAVVPGSPAERSGLRPGDLLVAIDGRPLSTLDDIRSAARTLAAASGEIEVSLERSGEPVTLVVPLPLGATFGQPSER